MDWRSRYSLEIVPSPDERWDETVASFRDSNMMQTIAYSGARFGPRRLVGMLLRERDGGRLASASLVVAAKAPLVPAGLAAVKFAPLWRPKDREPDPMALDAALQALRHEFADRRMFLLRVMPAADPDEHGRAAQRLAALGFERHETTTHPNRYFVRLQQSDGDMLASLAAGWRRNLRKAEQQGLEIAKLSGREALETFNRLYAAMRERKRFAETHGIEALGSLVGSSPDHASTRVLVARRAGGEAVAATVLVGSGDVVSVPFSATSDKALELKAGYLLRWHAMRLLREAGVPWLDLGGDEGDEGLRSFKTGNVGKSGVILPLAGEFDYCRNPVSRLAAKGAEFGRRLLHRVRLPRPAGEARSA